MKCPPAMHAYKAHGKVMYCIRCADVQPLLLDLPDEIVHRETSSNGAPRPQQEEYEAREEAPASVEELEHAANLLREAVGLKSPYRPQSGAPEQLDLGVRHTVDDEALVNMSNERTNPRVPVAEGFETGAFDEDLPDPGL